MLIFTIYSLNRHVYCVSEWCPLPRFTPLNHAITSVSAISCTQMHWPFSQCYSWGTYKMGETVY